MDLFTATGLADECPGRDTLIDFDLGKLPAPEIDAVARHVASCGRCEEVLHNLQSRNDDDRVIARLRRYLDTPTAPSGAAYDGMVVVAETLSASDTGAGTAGDEELGCTFGEMSGRSFGRYEVYGVIGEGGMGVVYLARQMRLKRMVALKMISAGRHAGPLAVARFVREGKAFARLRHPNVVQVYELDQHDGLPFLSMELVDGGSLHAKLAAGPLEPREAAGIVRALAEAVDYAHSKDVVHRDLKPLNILLDRDGTPKISDFGIAKVLDAGADADGITTAHLTELHAVLGTASYMSPEQASGSPEIGRATDIYALGAILYECLAGRPPFVGRTTCETLDLVRSPARPVPPSRLRPGVPFWLESVCLKCLEKSPEDRYPSARALADDLGLWLGHERPKGVPGWLTRAGRVLRRNLAVVSAGLAITFVGGASIPIGVLINRNIAAHEIQAIRSELALGRTVTLIRPTGKPAWFRWRCGEGSGHLTIATDQTCNLESWPLSLVELLPDPQTGSYRVTAQLRHNRSAPVGEVGLYFAHSTHTGGPADFQFFTQLTFNAVYGEADFRATIIDQHKPPLPPRSNLVTLCPHLRADDGARPLYEWVLTSATGLPFEPRGEQNGHWYELELTVTPEGVTVRLDGRSFFVAARDIEERLRADFRRPLPPKSGRPAMNALTENALMEFTGRGGLGLYVWRGSASFRSVTVTPLAIN